MTLRDYIKEYDEIALRGSEKGDDMIVRFELWVAIRWLDEIDAEPWESDKILTAISELVDSEEYELIDVIGRGMSAFFKMERNFWKHIDDIESKRNSDDDGQN